MTAPNLSPKQEIPVSTFRTSTSDDLTTTPTQLLTNPASSNQVFNIKTILVSNVDGVNDADVSVNIVRGGTTYSIASTINVPADSSLPLVSDLISFYLEEGDAISAYASANNDLRITIVYEVIGAPYFESDISLSYIDYVTTTNNPTSPFTSATINFGAEPTSGKRYIVAVISFSQIGAAGDYTFPLTNITIGGQSAEWVTGAQGSTLHNFVSLAYAEVPTGISGTVAFTYTGSGGTSSFIATYSVLVPNGYTLGVRDTYELGPLSTATTTISLDTEPNDAVITGIVVRNGTASPTFTDVDGFGFSGLDFTIDQQDGEYTSAAGTVSSISGTAQQVTFTDNVADLTSSAIVGATFNPIATSLTYITDYDLGNTTGNSFSQTINIGAEDPNRWIILSFHTYSNTTATTFSNITINGNAVDTLVNNPSGSTSGSGIYAYYLPTGTTATFVANYSTSIDRNAAVGVYRLIRSNATPQDTDFANASLGNSVTVNTTIGGAALFSGTTVSTSGGSAGTPTNFVEDYEFDIRSNEWAVAGISNATLGGAVTMSHTGQQTVYAVSWD